uniref:Citramalyl-CoA lyase, mitochondrial n=1 Tax=Panagrolaimus superbus TaxID=310955 RepID=A0A914Z2V9_9BILA
MFSKIFTRNLSTNVMKIDRKGYIPRRALLYVPGSNEKMLTKVPTIKVDSLVLELEDGVALTSKTIARHNIAKYLDNLESKGDHQCFELGVRINSVSSGLLLDDLKELSKAKQLPQAFMIPKVDSPEDLAAIWDAFRSTYGAERIQNSGTRLVIWIESAQALLDMPRILSTTLNMNKNAGFFKLDAVVFGSDDFCANIGATRSNEGTETLFARQRFVTCCKAFNLQAIDSVYIDIKDIEGLRRQSLEGKAWGFDGKQSIHPTQIPIIQESFLPPPDKVQWAKELIDEFVKHEQSGKGAFTFKGSMIDRPLLLQAMNIVQTIKYLENL